MKKALMSLVAAMALFATAASAQVTGFTKYDYDRATNNLGNHQQLAVGVAVPTSVGTFDAAVVGNRLSGFGQSETRSGWEVGYTNGIPLLAGQVTGRVGLGQRNAVAGDHVRYYSVGVEYTAPLTKQLGVFAGYRHRNLTNFDLSENRYTAGVDFAINEKLSLRAGYAATRVGGVQLNGVTTAVSYAF